MAKNKKVYDVCHKRIIAGTGKDFPAIHAEVVREADERKEQQRQDSHHNDHKVIQLNNVRGINKPRIVGAGSILHDKEMPADVKHVQ